MKICWAQYLLWFVVAVLGTGSALSACGQKGALYLPDQPPTATDSNTKK
jgi:predicted small lipoprotein YifL